VFTSSSGLLLAGKQFDKNVGNICADVICALQTAVFIVIRIIMKINLLIFCNLLQLTTVSSTGI
jgi:hypothetical protein